MFGNFLFGCGANREEMLNSQKPPEEPKKNGVVITPQEPVPAKYEFYRGGLLLGNFEKNGSARWGYTPRVQEHWPSTIAYNATLTAEECSQIAAQLRVLNEQSTNEGDIACK